MRTVSRARGPSAAAGNSWRRPRRVSPTCIAQGGRSRRWCLSTSTTIGSGCLGALGVLAALLRRADEGGSWLVRVALAKTAMLGTRFADNHELAEPVTDAELDRYLVDQESPIGLLTRIAPAVGLDRTPAY